MSSNDSDHMTLSEILNAMTLPPKTNGLPDRITLPGVVAGVTPNDLKEREFVLKSSPLTEVEFCDGAFKIIFSTGPDTKLIVHVDDPALIMALVKQLLESMKAHSRAEEAKKH